MSWISTYLDYTKDLESPRLFHVWSAIAVLGHVLGRKTWISRQGKFNHYPGQIMVILVAKSAVARKTTAALSATPFFANLPEWAVHVLPSKLSPQQLLQCMQDIGTERNTERAEEGTKGDPLVYPWGDRRDCCGFIEAGELGEFFTAEEFARQLPTQICALNEAKDGERRYSFRSWKAVVYNPCVGMVGCTTPDGLAKELPEQARTTGYLGRVLLVHSEPGNNPNPLTGEEPPVPVDVKCLQTLREGAERMAWMHGPFRLTQKAKVTFDEWYYAHYDKIRKLGETETAADDTGYGGRKDDHALRVGCVLSAAEDSSLWIRQQHILTSLDMLKEIEPGYAKATAEVGVKAHADVEARILHLLERADKWVPLWRITRAVHRYGDKRAREQALDSLEEAQMLERKHEGEHWIYRRRGKK